MISHTEAVSSSDHHGALSAKSLRRPEPPTGLKVQATGGSGEERRCNKTFTPVLFLETLPWAMAEMELYKLQRLLL